MKESVVNHHSKTRVLVVDDQPLLREGVIQFLNRQIDLAACGEADNVASARSAVVELDPDLVLLELRLGSGDTIGLIKEIRSQSPRTQVLVFSQFEETQFALRALKAGARGYVQKREPASEVLAAIKVVLSGGMYVSRQIAVLVLQKTLEEPADDEAVGESTVKMLSDRELHVFQMIGAGLSSRQIAGDLNLSIKTVETHRENIKHKLGLRSGADLCRRAENWVKLGSNHR